MSKPVIDFYDAIKTAPSRGAFFNIFAKALIPFGVNDFSYVFLCPIDARHRPDAKDIIFTTYTAAMLQQLGGTQGFSDDLTRLRAQKGLDTVWTDDSLWETATPPQMVQYGLEREAGLENGYTHVLDRFGQMTASIALRMDGLTRTEFEKSWPEISEILLPITQIMHSHFAKDHMPKYFNLSLREQDVLSWLAMGLRPEEIADKLKIGYRSVDKYIVSAKEKLGAKSRDHAVARALSLGLLVL